MIGISFAQSAGYQDKTDDCTQGDLMQQSYCIAKEQKNIIDLGNTKSAVGNEVIMGSTEISGSGINNKPSTIVRITQFILMLTIVLAVTMIIFNGMQYIIKSGSGEDPKKVQSNIIYIIVGIVLALFSVVLVNLLRSTGKELFEEAKKGVSSISSQETSSLV